MTTIVNMPQALSFNALTTTLPVAANVVTMMISVASVAATPATGPSRFRTNCGSDLPSWRTEANSTTKSCTPPAKHEPTTIQENAGRYPHCAANTGPTSGPEPAMAAKWTPNNTNRRVGW